MNKHKLRAFPLLIISPNIFYGVSTPDAGLLTQRFSTSLKLKREMEFSSLTDTLPRVTMATGGTVTHHGIIQLLVYQGRID